MGLIFMELFFDELHTQPNRKLYRCYDKGFRRCQDAASVFPDHYSRTDTNSICYETHQKAKDILEGRKIDPTFYPVIYGADEGDDWTDPRSGRGQPVSGHHGGDGQGEGSLRVSKAESRRGKLLPAAAAEPVGEAGGALDADGEMGSMRLRGQ